ncbi:MAG: T9SS type A sorting domain-containing protein, partial [Ignavibacteriales bacterium]|nr:T9SS type A sorting domain-containing protein [Ignavibacteriales bacterium]
ITDLENNKFITYITKNESGLITEGIRGELDSLYYTIYSNNLKEINLGYKQNVTDIKNITEIPIIYALYQNFPNPFNPSTSIKFSIPETANVKLIVYDVLGKAITTLVNENKSPGNYDVEFNASYLSSGIYFYKIEMGKYVSVKKMMLIK